MAPDASSSGDWQDACVDLKQRGAQLLRSGAWTDCTFLVGAGREAVSAHRLLLAMASPVFEAMFYGAMPPGDDPIPIPDMEVEAFKIMLQYIYTDKIAINSFNTACDLYYGARKYLFKHLVQECRVYLVRNLSSENACRGYEVGTFFDEKAITEEAMQLFKYKTREIVSNISFNSAELSTIMTIFSMKSLNIDSELDLLHAVERYARHHAISVSPDDHDITEETVKSYISTAQEKLTPVSDKVSLRSAMQLIRFLTLSPPELAECHTLNKVLSKDEVLAIIMNSSTPQATLPMPHGFSTSTKLRNLGRTEATFRFIVPDAINIRDFYSPSFYVCNLPWRIMLKPLMDQHRTYLAAFLFCNWEDTSEWICQAENTMTLFSLKPGHDVIWKSGNLSLFKRNSNNWGNRRLILWDFMCDPENGYLRNGAITLQINLRAAASK